jgi:hypothetical protein
MTLAELRIKYPKARMHLEPNPMCKRCDGTGEEAPRKLSTGTMLNASPCICVFVKPAWVPDVEAGLLRAAEALKR